MINPYFLSIENKPDQTSVSLHAIFENLAFNVDGLIPVITQDAKTKSVLMLAWMNEAAIKQTLDTKKVTYWSRSRKSFWIKGESSGNTQELISMSLDCDGDALLCLVNQVGGACHTGRESCFYLDLDIENQQATINGNSK